MAHTEYSLQLLQQNTEKQYSKHQLEEQFKVQLKECEALQPVWQQCLQDLNDNYLGGDHYQQKNDRLAQFHIDDLEEVMERIMFISSQYGRLSMSNLCGQASGQLPLDKPYNRLQMCGEIAAYMAKNGLIGLELPQAMGNGRRTMMQVESYFAPDKEFVDFAAQCMYLPPLVCEPKELTNNRSSGWQETPFGSLITKAGNHHEGEISLDVLNRRNRIVLKLNEEFLCKVDEHITAEDLQDSKGDTDEAKLEQYKNFQSKSYEVFKYLIQEGNKFHLLHKVDKRGRVYSQGYHCSYQGNSFRKAMVEFAEEEIVTGV